jgi:hypothetical protein
MKERKRVTVVSDSTGLHMVGGLVKLRRYSRWRFDCLLDSSISTIKIGEHSFSYDIGSLALSEASWAPLWLHHLVRPEPSI